MCFHSQRIDKCLARTPQLLSSALRVFETRFGIAYETASSGPLMTLRQGIADTSLACNRTRKRVYQDLFASINEDHRIYVKAPGDSAMVCYTDT
jgi:hypothetical protein